MQSRWLLAIALAATACDSEPADQGPGDLSLLIGEGVIDVAEAGVDATDDDAGEPLDMRLPDREQPDADSADRASPDAGDPCTAAVALTLSSQDAILRANELAGQLVKVSARPFPQDRSLVRKGPAPMAPPAATPVEASSIWMGWCSRGASARVGSTIGCFGTAAVR